MRPLVATLSSIALAVALSAVAAPADQTEPLQSAAMHGSAAPELRRETAPQLTENDRMLLDEYRLADSVKTRVLGDLKAYGAVLGLALAFIGFLGFQVVVDLVTRRIEKSAKEDLERIRSRIQTALIDVELAVLDGKRSSNTAEKQVATLRQRHAELEDLAAKYQALHAQIQEIGQLVERASTAAAESRKEVAGLGVALSDTFAGSPAVFTSSFDWNRGGMVGGKNFGSAPGKLHLWFWSGLLRAAGDASNRQEMDPVEVDQSHIEVWSDTEIRFSISKSAMDEINQFRTRQDENWKQIDPSRMGERTHSFDFVVERMDGARSAHLRER